MKKWSKSWNRSKKPKKQRKYIYNAPLHIARKLMSVRLNKDLKAKYSKRNIPIRKNDKVKIAVGQFKGKIVKVSSVDLKNKLVYLVDIFAVKKDGSKVPIGLQPSNLVIIELDLEDIVHSSVNK